MNSERALGMAVIVSSVAFCIVGVSMLLVPREFFALFLLVWVAIGFVSIWTGLCYLIGPEADSDEADSDWEVTYSGVTCGRLRPEESWSHDSTPRHEVDRDIPKDKECSIDLSTLYK